MTALASTSNTAPAEQSSLQTWALAVERMASNPNVDVDKLERLMQMHERMQARQAASEFATDLAAMQTELPSVGERGNAANRYTFALWEDINAAIKPALSRFGFALSFRTDFANGIAVTGVLSHRSGHTESTTIVLPSDPSGNKNPVQAVASSVSYGKRYTAGALLNLTSHGEDDDAFSAGNPEPAADITSWADAIRDASSMDELNRLAAELAKNPLSGAALKNVRALWAKRAKEFK